jgi:hypothetical protein
MVAECSDRPDVHRSIGNKLFEFRELCGVMVSDELYATQEEKKLIPDDTTYNQKCNCLVHNKDFIVDINRQVIGLHDEVILGICVRR